MHAALQTVEELPVGEAVGRKLRLVVVLLLWTVTWALLHGYDGIEHDAQLYTLQALAHLRPQSLSHDVFLSFGSQDRYTLFSPLYATIIGWLGTEPAAAILTLILQLAFLASAFLLTRKLVSPTLTLLGLSVLIATPGFYGASRVFTCIETFVTPRMAAEALVLCGLSAALSTRGWLALTLVALAMLVHPVMGAAGLAALACLNVAIPQPRLAAILSLVALIALVAIALVLPLGPFSRFEADWLALVRLRSPNLFLANWTLDDWGRALVTLATLTVGVGTLPAGRARTLCQATLITGLGSLVLTLISCDLLQLVRFTQLQPWRWMWLATAAASLLLPAITLAGWQSGLPGRATVLLLAAAWIFGADPLALDVALAAVVSMALTRRLSPDVARLVFYGTCGLLAIAVTARLGWNSLFLDAFYYDPAIASGIIPSRVKLAAWRIQEAMAGS